MLGIFKIHNLQNYNNDHVNQSTLDMGININLLVIKSCVLLWNISSVTGENLKCENENEEYVSYACWQPPKSNGSFSLPGDLPKIIQSLSISVDEPNSTWVVTQMQEFSSYTFLNTLHINTSKSWHFSKPYSIQIWKSKLFEVPSLQILRVEYVQGYNNDQHLWILPDKLLHLYLENSVMDFDLRSTDNLISLYLINASLPKIPDNNGLHWLTILDLRNNPLDDLNSIQLASFCSLEEVDLRDASITECECKRINRLFDELKKHTRFISHYNCRPSKDENCTSNWHEVSRIREKCLSEVTWALYRTVAIVMTVVGLTIVVCVFCSVWLLKPDA